MNVLLGLIKSKSIWFALLSQLLPYAQTYLTGMPVDWTQVKTLLFTGVSGIVLRALTDQSLSNKGAGTPPQPPPAP